jgi:hypothetical protein
MNFTPTDILTATGIFANGRWYNVEAGSARYAHVDAAQMLPPGTTPPAPMPAGFWVIEFNTRMGAEWKVTAFREEDVRSLRF